MLKWLWRKPQERYADLPTAQLRAGFGTVQAGVPVNEQTALTLTSVYAAVRVISETLATLPLPIYQRLSDGGKERFRQHPLYRLLNVSPDGVIGAVQWREAMVAHVLTWGNGYSEIEFNGAGEALALHLIPPNRVQPFRQDDGSIAYKVPGGIVPQERMLHIAGLGFDGVVGYRSIVSNQIPSNLTKGSGTNLTALIMGIWSDLIIGMWGATDVIVDPYSGATSGNVRIAMLQDCDVQVRNAVSFSKIVDLA